jgi:hypothetical protein
VCEKCAELDSRIEHYQPMASRIIFDGIKKLIERVQAEKAALHPDQEH